MAFSAAVGKGIGIYCLNSAASLKEPCHESKYTPFAPEFAHPALQDEEEALRKACEAVEQASEPDARGPDEAKWQCDDEAFGRHLVADLVSAARKGEVDFHATMAGGSGPGKIASMKRGPSTGPSATCPTASSTRLTLGAR